MHKKIIGEGNTATVYEWSEGKVLKLFHQGYSKDAIEKEFHNTQAIANLDFSKPKVYELTCYNERMGIVYERLDGISLLDWVSQTQDIQGCAKYMAGLHKAIIQNKVEGVPDYKVFLRQNIENALSLDLRIREEALEKLDCLPNGDTLCHGDFHPGNIFISNEQIMVLDFMNVCHGHFLYDIARTLFLLQYTPVPPALADQNGFLQFRKTLADLYLIQMKVTREMLQDYLSVIIVSRAGECPDEQQLMIRNV